MDILKKVAGVIAGLVVGYYSDILIHIVILFVGATIFGDGAAQTLDALGNIAGVVFGIMIGIKVYQLVVNKKGTTKNIPPKQKA